MFATMNLGAKSQFENGSIYGWGMNRPAQLQSYHHTEWNHAQ